ncbi:hypothetical protein Ahy_B08g092744 [Arachis hypogaea]|uniref:Uncharacterized protein n=1 Tax=Arachis hypogaea TaxID=3818 RepID=A0A444Y4K8_ARAHY|nr:hypothetical protein Ahy_B08g092744 [Arachis hypogaea]
MVESSEINRSLLALLDENIADAHRSSQKQAAEYMEKLRGALLKFENLINVNRETSLTNNKIYVIIKVGIKEVRIFPQLEEIQLRRMEKLKDIWPHEDEDGRLKDQLRNDNFSSLQRQLIETKEAIERQRKLFKKIQYGIILLPLLYLVHCFLKLEGRA